MYKKILIPIDNSSYSAYCTELGIKMAEKFNSFLVGCHVYDATLHQKRFRDMEKGLPPKYQDEQELQRQRELHTSLINQGLRMISESYLDVFRKKCASANVQHTSVLLEGKNYHEIIKEVRDEQYDLVIIGLLGLASVDESIIGSVCERVVRRVNTDVVIVKNEKINGKIVVAVDGSDKSMAGVQSAISLGKQFGMNIEAVSVYDPHYHRVAFESIANVLSDEAGKIFRFKEQETLHEEIIDKGLAKIYQNHLDRASNIAKDAGVNLKTVLLDGKPFEQVLKYINDEPPSLLIIGRTGIHNKNGLDLGSTTENLIRLAPCNVLLTGGDITSQRRSSNYTGETAGLVHTSESIKEKTLGFKEIQEDNRYEIPTEEVYCGGENTKTDSEITPIWSHEAKKQTERIPAFIRGVVRKRIEKYAQGKGQKEITPDIVKEVKFQYMGKDCTH